MAKRSIELFSEYAEYGHQGSKEVTTTYALSVEESSRDSLATLVVEREERSFPESGDRNVSESRFLIRVEELAQFIMKAGSRS